MKTLRIITHCYSTKLPHYAAFLKLQMSSLQLYPAKNVDVVFEVCHSPFDHQTIGLLHQWFNVDKTFKLNMRSMLEPRLFRRAIGRNEAALQSKEDAVWFCDADYFFGPNCIDSLAINWPSNASLVFPPEVQIHKTHEIGDSVAARAIEASEAIIDLDTSPELFTTKRYGRAIGGVQIVDGSYVRDRGYLNGSHKYLKPVKDGEKIFVTKGDVAFRSQCFNDGLISRPVSLPSLYRLRHTTNSYQ